MESAKLIKHLERLGFELDYDRYDSYEEMIVEILKSENHRLYPSIILLLANIDYSKIILQLNDSQIKEFHKAILIANKLSPNEKLTQLIKQENIQNVSFEKDYSYYKDRYEESIRIRDKTESGKLDLKTELRTNIDTTQALRILFKPGKLKILNKIFIHEELSKTETNYYYRSIKPIINAVMTPNLHKYLLIINKIKSKR